LRMSGSVVNPNANISHNHQVQPWDKSVTTSLQFSDWPKKADCL
jgi:hypothetical protein